VLCSPANGVADIMAKSHKASFQYESSGIAHVGTLEVQGSGVDTTLAVKTKFGSGTTDLGRRSLNEVACALARRIEKGAPR
jgi:hypothetical protein